MTESLFRQTTYTSLRQSLACLLSLAFKLKVKKSHPLPMPCIFAGNHSSFLDGPIVMMFSRQRIHFLVDEGVKNWLLIGWILGVMGAIFIPQSRPKRAVIKLIEAAKSGKHICIFPEGKLTTTGNLNEMSTGVIFVSQKTALPIVPFYIEGAFNAWPWGKKTPKLTPITVQIGAPIYPENLPADPKEAISILRTEIEKLAVTQ